MTISSTSRKTALLTGNGATVAYSFSFKVQASTDVVVYMLEDDVETLVSAAGYTVVLNGDQNVNPGGTLTFDTAPTADQDFIITTAAPATQTQSIQNQSSFNPTVVTEALDKLTIQVQQLKEKADRAFTLPITSDSAGAVPTPENGTVLGWAAGALSWVAQLTGDLVSSFMQTPLLVSSAHAFAKAVDGSITLANYAALTALTSKAANVTYIVRGKTTAGDGGGGVFRYDASSTATDDGGTCLANDGGGTGRSLRVFSGPAISSWFFPSDGTTQTTALQALLTNHRYIRLENGTVVSAAVTIPANTYVFGSRLAILKQSSTSGDFITYSGDNVEVVGITIDGNQTTDTSAGGYTSGHNGVVCTGTSGTPKVNPRLSGCLIKNFGMHGVKFTFVDTQHIQDNAVERCGYAGIGLLSPLNAWVEGNHVKNIYPGDGSANSYGIYSSNSGGDRVSIGVHITNNSVADVLAWEGIDVHDGKRCTIAGNYVDNCAQGIVYEDHTVSSPGEDIVISGNVISGWSGTTTTKDSVTYYKTGGIICNGANTDEYGKSLAVIGNLVSRMGDTRLVAGGGAINARNWRGAVISNNIILDAFGIGISLSESGTAGLREAVVSGNVINGVTAHNGLCRGIQATDLVEGRAADNIVVGLSSGTEKFYQSETSTYKLIFEPHGGPLAPVFGRLTSTSNTPEPTTTVAAVTTIYFTPHNGNSVPMWNGSEFVTLPFTQRSLTLATAGTGYHQADKVFDVFLFLDAGTLRLGTGPAWSSNTASPTGAATSELTTVQGVRVNLYDVVLRFGMDSGNTVTCSAGYGLWLGTIRTTGTDGETADSDTKRYISNYYNPIWRPMKRMETTDSWNYSTAVWRQANGSTSNALGFVNCRIRPASCDITALAKNSTATVRAVRIAVGLDSTSAIATDSLVGKKDVNESADSLHAKFQGFVGVGAHDFNWLEYAEGTDTQTWFGDAGFADRFQCGMYAMVYQ